MPPVLAVMAVTERDLGESKALARKLGLSCLPAACSPLDYAGEYTALLLVNGAELALQQLPPAPARGHKGRAAPPGPVIVDFGSRAMRYRRMAGHNELLGRAVGVTGSRRPRVLDATAGLGRDSFILADMGCVVTLCEREPVIAALLDWGLRAALASEDAWLAGVARRMRLLPGDARSWSGADRQQVDVIYLDPMFPPRDKRAAVKKDMALFQLLLDSPTARDDAADLLAWALQRDVARVVVKRPPRGEYLADIRPSHSISGKAVRFDVHVRRALD